MNVFNRKFSALILLILASHLSIGQVGCEELLTSYSPLKQYRIIPNKRNEFSYVLTKGTNYLVSICTKDTLILRGLKLEVYDSKRRLVTTRDVFSNKQMFRFTCKKDGIYYINYSCEKSQPETFTSVLAFHRNSHKKSKPKPDSRQPANQSKKT